MQCSHCTLELPLQSGQCPYCGFGNTREPQPSFGRRNPVRLILICFLGLSVLALIVQRGIAAYRQVQANRPSQETSSAAPRPTPAPEVPATHFAVEHGRVANPEDLHGHGKLYFVPVGRQAIFVRSLATYYAEKFGIQIYILPEVKLGPAACVPERNQCIAEEVMGAMTNAYPEIARNPESVMIALTDEDIFPLKLGWEFTYSLHSARVGVVSTRRMDPAFWGGPQDPALRLASTRQMLTKYVAMEYFHLPDSFDPTSVMFSPLTPNGGPDDIYESDLHSEASANGQRGNPFPCLFFSYSYKTHQVKTEAPLLSNCEYHNSVATTDEENFETNLGWGLVAQRTMDLQLSSTPAIELKRGYNSGYTIPKPLALGWGTNHSYDPWLSSDGVTELTYINIVREDGASDDLHRVTPGRGFSASAVYESQDDSMYGARMTWETDHYELQYRDGSWATFLPCDSGRTRCYWSGYQDAKGNSLRFDRGPDKELLQLTASDNQGVNFQLDDQRRVVRLTATDGSQVAYEYSPSGCLARVRRADGQETLYEYDLAHRMTSMSVIRSAGAAPETVLANEYDSRGRVVKQTFSGIGSYQIEYLATAAGYSTKLKITTPAGDVLNVSIGPNQYVARSVAVQFQAVPRP
jgi:YD repeat-containing protein